MFAEFFRRDSQLLWLLTPQAHSEGSKENHTGKVILPQYCLADLDSKQVETPYVFRISAHDGVSYTHAGVHEFTGENQVVVLPQWMYSQLALDKAPVEITCAALPKGVYIRLLPQSKEFLELENPKLSLEDALRNYQVLSKGDTISLYIKEEFKSILFTVAEIKPEGEGISIIDTDLEVDFLPPSDYKEEKIETGDSLIAGTDKGIFIKDPFFGANKGLGVIFVEASKEAE
ncbi:ubiquitin fusion degradation protein 1 [Nematocida sp. AWRm77]|nr:ubiquitin fusion degradation protein 1 [Nematocida sp. AWRm77]